MPGVEGILEDLREIEKDVAALQRRVGELGGQTLRGQQVKMWSKKLRRLLQRTRAAVRARLKDESGKPLRLYVPPFKSVAGRLIQAANDIELALRPRLPELVAKKVPPELLDQVHDASVQLWMWRKIAPNPRPERTKVREQLTQRVSEGRLLIDELRNAVADQLDADARLKAEFNAAAKVKAKPGPTPEPSKPKREATYRKRPKRPNLAEPQRIEAHMTAEELQSALAEEAFDRLKAAKAPEKPPEIAE